MHYISYRRHDRISRQLIPIERRNLTSAILTPDGRFIITCLADGTIRYLDTSTGQCLHTWTLHDTICNANLSPDEKTVACVGKLNLIHLIDTRISHCIKHLAHIPPRVGDRTPSIEVYSSDFHPNGIQLATAGTKVVNLWDLRTFNVL